MCTEFGRVHVPQMQAWKFSLTSIVEHLPCLFSARFNRARSWQDSLTDNPSLSAVWVCASLPPDQYGDSVSVLNHPIPSDLCTDEGSAWFQLAGHGTAFVLPSVSLCPQPQSVTPLPMSVHMCIYFSVLFVCLFTCACPCLSMCLYQCA